MSVKDMWQRTQVYFGIKEEDWDDDYFDDDGSAAHEDLERSYSERPNVRRLNPRRRSGADFDDIFSDEPVAAPRGRGRGGGGGSQNGGQRNASQVELVVPKSLRLRVASRPPFTRAIAAIMPSGTDMPRPWRVAAPIISP